MKKIINYKGSEIIVERETTTTHDVIVVREDKTTSLFYQISVNEFDGDQIAQCIDSSISEIKRIIDAPIETKDQKEKKIKNKLNSL